MKKNTGKKLWKFITVLLLFINTLLVLFIVFGILKLSFLPKQEGIEQFETLTNSLIGAVVGIILLTRLCMYTHERYIYFKYIK